MPPKVKLLKVSEEVEKVLHMAQRAQDKAYAPYSQFKVGAAFITDKGEIVTGHNIENSSYGATVCAERVALWKWVSDGLRGKVQFVVVVTPTDKASPPCGLCLQVLSEFCDPTTKIYLAGKEGIDSQVTLEQLFPMSFHLHK